jgi:hypothetical protein
MSYFVMILLGFALAGFVLDFGNDKPDEPHSL